MKYFLIVFLFLFFSCKSDNKTSLNFFENLVFVSDFNLNLMENSQKKWSIFCETSIINEDKNILECNKPYVNIYKDKIISATITGKTGIVDMSKRKSMIKSEVKINSYLEKMQLYANELYFDSKANKIWSYSDITVIKNDIKTQAKGFIAKPDLSNIKFIKHETKKI